MPSEVVCQFKSSSCAFQLFCRGTKAKQISALTVYWKRKSIWDNIGLTEESIHAVVLWIFIKFLQWQKEGKNMTRIVMIPEQHIWQVSLPGAARLCRTELTASISLSLSRFLSIFFSPSINLQSSLTRRDEHVRTVLVSVATEFTVYICVILNCCHDAKLHM